MKLTAIKSLKYNTRRLLPGDEFEAKPTHGRLLVAVKKAREIREVGKVAPPPASLAKRIKETPAPDDMATARAEYQVKFGKRPYMGWDKATLQAKMAEPVNPAPTEIAAETPSE